MKFSDLAAPVQNVAQKLVTVYGAMIVSGPLLVVKNGVADGNTNIPNSFGAMTKEQIFEFVSTEIREVEQDAASLRRKTFRQSLSYE